MVLLFALEELLGQMYEVYNVARRKEIDGEKVPNEEKIFSIFEPHTDIIVKGGREVVFGHKVNLISGRSNLILHCDVLEGNPGDSRLYQSSTKAVIQNYETTPRDSVGDGGFASKENIEFAELQGITNVVFSKIRGSLQNIVTSDNMETRLKKWRSGIEAVISNFKRGFDLTRCIWKGLKHFSRKVLWSVIGYNIQVLSRLLIAKMAIE
jgi:IS5 family transposase